MSNPTLLSSVGEEPSLPSWARIVTGSAGDSLAWLWGFCEGMFFFVVPDVLFTMTMLVSPKRGWRQFGLAIAGAIVAGALMYSWASIAPAQARAAVASVPFVGEKIIGPAETRWAAGGTLSLFRNPLSGVPYKVPAVLAPAHVSFAKFVALSVPLRAERMLLSMVVFVPVGLWIRRGDEATQTRRRLIGFRVHLAFWTIVYAVYWTVNR